MCPSVFSTGLQVSFLHSNVSHESDETFSYLEIFIVVNRPYFVPHTIPYYVFKFSTVPPVT